MPRTGVDCGWVRAKLQHEVQPGDAVLEDLAGRLEEKYALYRGRPFDRVLAFRVIDVIGWSAT